MIFHFIISAMILFGLSTSSHAAAVLLNDVSDSMCRMKLEGPIEPRDLQKIKSLVKSIYTSPAQAGIGFDDPYSCVGNDLKSCSICLDSHGGSWEEGLVIAKYFLKSGISTVIEKAANCHSACAIIFMSGTYNTESGSGIITSRKLHIKGRLGFHAPYLQIPKGEYNDKTVQNAYRSAILAIGQFSEMSKEAGFDQRLITQMLKAGPYKIFLIDTVDKAGRWGISLYGYAISKRFTKKMVVNACANNWAWSGQYSFYGHRGYKRLSNSSLKLWKKNIKYKEKKRKKHSVCCMPIEGEPTWCHVPLKPEVDTYFATKHFKNASLTVQYISELPDLVGSQEEYIQLWSLYPPEMKLEDIPEGDGIDG